MAGGVAKTFFDRLSRGFCCHPSAPMRLQVRVSLSRPYAGKIGQFQYRQFLYPCGEKNR
jgi:hypothetical protein